jgi:hypothetical protein
VDYRRFLSAWCFIASVIVYACFHPSPSILMLKVASRDGGDWTIHFAKTILEAIFADINVAFVSNKSLVCGKYFWLFVISQRRNILKRLFWVLFLKITFNFCLLIEARGCREY